MAGIIATGPEWAASLRRVRAVTGGVLHPLAAYLLHRGLQTLPIRVRAQQESAQRVAEWLSAHPAVEAVHYPGLPDDRGHPVARRQMGGFGGMVSFEVLGGAGPALAVVSRVRLLTPATSLGGTETLVEHRASVEGPESRTPQGLLRLSIGLEHPDDLIEDLDQALG